MFFVSYGERDTKRSLTPRERQFLYENAKGKCEICHRKISFFEMEVGHKKAWAKSGHTTLKNSLCLCHKCNHDMYTDTPEQFAKKRGIVTPEMKIKEVKQKLKSLTVEQLKALATKHKVKITGTVERGVFSDRRLAPTKLQYINKLSSIVTAAELNRSRRRTSPKTSKS